MPKNGPMNQLVVVANIEVSFYLWLTLQSNTGMQVGGVNILAVFKSYKMVLNIGSTPGLIPATE